MERLLSLARRHYQTLVSTHPQLRVLLFGALHNDLREKVGYRLESPECPYNGDEHSHCSGQNWFEETISCRHLNDRLHRYAMLAGSRPREDAQMQWSTEAFRNVLQGM